MKLISTASMKQAERNANSHGLSYLDMMGNAGAAAVSQIFSRRKVSGEAVLVLAGKGNNGGDALVAARLLSELGAEVSVFLPLGEPVTSDAAAMHGMLPEQVRLLEPEEALEQVGRAAVIVDGVFGTGFHGTLSQAQQTLFAEVNASGAYVVSLDIPSGVTADTGEVSENSIRADLTVMFDTCKNAALFRPGCEYCGECVAAPIGISVDWKSGLTCEVVRTGEEFLTRWIAPRPSHAHKGQSGRLLAVVGSEEYIGAALLSTGAALRTGCGYVTLASVPEVCRQAVAAQHETVLCPLAADARGRIARENLPLILEKAARADAVLLGCGLGQSEELKSLVRELILQTEKPILVDADGINLLAADINILSGASGRVVLTPHLGEMSRLSGLTVGQIAGDPVGAAQLFSQHYQVTLLLKGHNTILAAPDGRVMLNPTGGSGLAKAGSGDVLSGIIASLLAQGIPPFESAVCGAYLHGWAADLCCRERSVRGMMPSDLGEYLCRIFLTLDR